MNIQEIKKSYEEKLKQLQDSLSLLGQYDDNEDVINITSNRLFYQIISGYSVQKKAPISDKHLITFFSFIPVPANQNHGDAKDDKGKFYEFKTSFTNKGNNLNIRQVRLWQKVDYYYCFFINEQEIEQSLFFKLSHEEMSKEVFICGSATHGTKQANEDNQNIEYSITIPVYDLNNVKTKRWREKYLQGGWIWNQINFTLLQKWQKNVFL